MPKRLLLWDIDATLITTGGAGEQALKQMVAQRFGAADDFHDIEIAGRTDAHIAQSILRKYRVDPSEENLAQFQTEYLSGLATRLPQISGRVLPGVREILQRLHANPERVLGLLTGNLKRGAELKLEHYDLAQFFEFGAFADDHHDRNELGTFARKRAREITGEDFAASQIDVIGDTGHDIACGKIFGARTIAVATGSWTRERLAAAQPDFLFDDFSQVDDVMRQLGW